MDERKLVSWRIETLEDNQREMVNKWLDKQPNIQGSLTNLVLHMIRQFGYTNMLDFDVQERLYTNSISTPAEKPVQKAREVKEVKSVAPVQASPQTKMPENYPIEQVIESVESEDTKEDDLYKDLEQNL